MAGHALDAVAFPKLSEADLSRNMSTYLVRRVEETPNIEVLRTTDVRRMSGHGHLGEAELVHNKTGEVRELKTAAVFSFIGAVPRTDWLPAEIEKDAKEFVRTGPTLSQSPHWSARRQPFLLETSRFQERSACVKVAAWSRQCA